MTARDELQSLADEHALPGRSARARYSFALAAAVSALVVEGLVIEYRDDPIYGPSIGAIALTVWFGGLGPAVLAALISWTTALVLFVDPRGAFSFGGAEMTEWSVGLAVAILIIVVGGVLRFGRERASTAVVEAAQTIRNVESLQRLATELAAAVSPDDIARLLTTEASVLLDAQGAGLGLVEGDELVFIDTTGLAATDMVLAPTPLDSQMMITRAAREGVIARARDRATLNLNFPDSARIMPPAVHGALAVPVHTGGEVVGAIGFLFERENVVDDETEALAAIVADMAGQALERALLYERERSAREGLERILQVAPTFLAETADEVTAAICREARTTLGADVGVLWRLRGDRLVLIRVDPEDEPLVPGVELPLSDFPELEDAVERFGFSFVPDVLEEARGEGLERVRSRGIRSSLRLPIVIGGHTELVLVVSWLTVVPEPDPSTIVVARRFADQAGLAVEQLERRRAEAEAARRAEETRRLQEITAALSQAATPSEVASICLGHSLGAVGADAGLVALVATEGARAEVVAAEGYSTAQLEAWRELGLAESGPIAEALAGGGGKWAFSRAETSALPAARELGELGWVTLPLASSADVEGALHLSFRKQRVLSGGERRWLQTVVSQCALALERSRLYDQEQILRRRSERLHEMTVALANTLTRADVATVTVAELGATMDADGVALALVVQDRQVLRLLSWRGYPDELVHGLLEASLDERSPASRAVRRRESEFHSTPEQLDGLVRDASHSSAFYVPLVAGRRSNGLLTISWAEPKDLTSEDRRFVEALAGQAAQALDRALHFESEQTIAETLQRSVLPVSLPRVEGVQLAARYLPGTAQLDVGGDWFDALELPDGRLGLVVGDVVGKGVEAAASMGQLRNALRAFSLERLKPASVLSRLNRLSDTVLETMFATLVYVVIEPDGQLCRYSSAGHPPLVLACPDGRVELLEGGRGLPLGTGLGVTYTQEVVEIPAGSVLLLYSDGLVERRGRSIDEGLDALREAARAAPKDAERLVEHVLEHVVGDGEREDDIALLAVRILPVAPRPLDLGISSSPDSLDLVRDALRIWLEGAQAERDEAHDLLLATWEACANAIEHAVDPGRDLVNVRAELENGLVRVVIEDTGRWAPPTQRPERGLGLRLIHSLMSSVDIESTDGGTRVTLEKAIARTSR